jgi:hypothetical protein
MNERVKILWAKAAESNFGDSWEEQTAFMSKFAQLIVKECADLCEHESNDDEYDQYDMGMSVKAESIKTAIKKHFGVEE